MLAVGVVLLLGGALFGVGTWTPMSGTTSLGLQILGGALLVPALIASVLVVPAVIYRLRNRPARVRYQWTWPQLPHVDPKKEGDAEKIALENKTLSLTDALAARG